LTTSLNAGKWPSVGAKMRKALEAAGINFIAKNGVRLPR
jgi:hypothetical protein